MGRLANKNILITGGTSGIGLATAQEFAREGARVAICGLNERRLQVTREALGAGSLAVRADVSNLADLDAMFAAIKREFGKLDGVFANAGYSEFQLFEDVTEQSFDKVIAVNFKGAYFTIQKALPLLRRGSSVIISSSVGARKGWPTTSTVSTCKAALCHLARILSAELVDRGIRVNSLSPGPTDTAMFGRFPGEEQGEAVKDILRTNNPSKRMADPLEIAKLAVYLASDDSAYVVGADFLIDGGVTAISAVGA
jgi:NAD(P)-dependent dehydrogenase (short-subunit alcohol dehydrogenase family)